MEFISQKCISINTMNVRHKKSSLGFLPRVHVPLVQQEELMPCGYEATRFLWKSHWRTWIGSLIGGHELKVSKVYSFRTQVYSTEVSLNFAIGTSQSVLKVCSPLHSAHCLCLRCSSATPVNQLLTHQRSKNYFKNWKNTRGANISTANPVPQVGKGLF